MSIEHEHQSMTSCEICGEEFSQKSKYRNGRTCSDECAKELRAKAMRRAYARGGSWVTATCVTPGCGAEFVHRRCRPQKYCTKACYNRMVSESAQRERICARPGCEVVMTNYGRQEQQFCSVDCRNKYTATQRTINFPQCKVCGVSTESYNRIYCEEHRPKAGRPASPRKTATCQNPRCGEEFSRPGTWPGQMMFCSLKCSNEQHSRKRAQHYKHGEVNVNGSYELRFLACLARLNIPWEPFPDDQPFVHDGHTYTPDFVVEGMVIEVKGGERPGHPQIAMRAAWDRPEPLVLVDREKLGQLERIFNREQFLASLTELVVL